MSAEAQVTLQASADHPRWLVVAGARPVSRYERWVKPALDRLIGLVLGVLLLPVMLLTLLVVLAHFGRPVFFRQQRVGRAGVPFTLYKFRTMGPDRRRSSAEVPHDRRQTHKSEADPRHTGLGRTLRKCSLDELPQLWNVLRGDMSMIGPRPELVEVVERYEPWQHQRHVVKPGLTGLWQVSGRGRGHEPMHRLTHIDLAYVEKLGPLTDLSILLRTPSAVLLQRRGV